MRCQRGHALVPSLLLISPVSHWCFSLWWDFSVIVSRARSCGRGAAYVASAQALLLPFLNFLTFSQCLGWSRLLSRWSGTMFIFQELSLTHSQLPLGLKTSIYLANVEKTFSGPAV